MTIGVLGTGEVGKELAIGLRASGHEVVIGSRTPEKLSKWRVTVGSGVEIDSLENAVRRGELIFLATRWNGTHSAITLADQANFAGKIVVDVTNPLDFSRGQPHLALGYPQSGGVTVQSWLPDSHVVKCFNTVNAKIMAHPEYVSTMCSKPDMFLCGDDVESRRTVATIARTWGWDVQDLGGIENAYLLEALAMVWITHAMQTGQAKHSLSILNKGEIAESAS